MFFKILLLAIIGVVTASQNSKKNPTSYAIVTLHNGNNNAPNSQQGSNPWKPSSNLLVPNQNNLQAPAQYSPNKNQLTTPPPPNAVNGQPSFSQNNQPNPVTWKNNGQNLNLGNLLQRGDQNILGNIKGPAQNQQRSWNPQAQGWSQPNSWNNQAGQGNSWRSEHATQNFRNNQPLRPVEKNYNYRYDVEDARTGDKKYLQEARQDGVVKGEYALYEPDGSIRKVEYTADNVNGFNAIVSRDKNENKGYLY